MRLHKIKQIIKDIIHILTKRRLSFLKRLVLLFYFVKITVQNFLNNRLMTYKEVTFLGYTVSFSSFSEFAILVHEIFVEDPYYFKSSKKAPCIVDCGGNIGMSVLYFKWLYPDALITVFEPAPRACKMLRKNIEQNNLQGVTVVEKALSDENGSATIYLREDITLAATMEKNEAHGSGEHIVETVRLSDYIEDEIDFMKIDIQFSEQRVFEDLAKTNTFRHINRLIMEFHHHYGYESNSFGQTLQYLEQGGLHYFIELNCKKSDRFASYMLTAQRIENDTH
ncbi:FkbM family methyltransferase [Candidatus Pacebacteria bacterium]|nr:FkbM family methyltransferase [Candidatus Paceibacterota bacterium]